MIVPLPSDITHSVPVVSLVFINYPPDRVIFAQYFGRVTGRVYSDQKWSYILILHFTTDYTLYDCVCDK